MATPSGLAAEPAVLRADLPGTGGVQAMQTTRTGGVSRGPFASLNLAEHVGDDPADVAENRRRLLALLPAPPLWLRQVHGCDVCLADEASSSREADAAVSRQPGQVLAVLTADCLPVLFCGEDGAVVAAAHAGWRGLLAGVLERTVSAMDCDPAGISAWLGAGIGPAAFEVGDEVRTLFMAEDVGAEDCFSPRDRRWLADLPALARRRLTRAGVARVAGGDACTFGDSRRWFSYRRDGATGRMAALIWRGVDQGADGGAGGRVLPSSFPAAK